MRAYHNTPGVSIREDRRRGETHRVEEGLGGAMAYRRIRIPGDWMHLYSDLHEPEVRMFGGERIPTTLVVRYQIVPPVQNEAQEEYEELRGAHAGRVPETGEVVFTGVLEYFWEDFDVTHLDPITDPSGDDHDVEFGLIEILDSRYVGKIGLIGWQDLPGQRFGRQRSRRSGTSASRPTIGAPLT
jgi:hypothetical protein